MAGEADAAHRAAGPEVEATIIVTSDHHYGVLGVEDGDGFGDGWLAGDHFGGGAGGGDGNGIGDGDGDGYLGGNGDGDGDGAGNGDGRGHGFPEQEIGGGVAAVASAMARDGLVIDVADVLLLALAG